MLKILLLPTRIKYFLLLNFCIWLCFPFNLHKKLHWQYVRYQKNAPHRTFNQRNWVSSQLFLFFHQNRNFPDSSSNISLIRVQIFTQYLIEKSRDFQLDRFKNCLLEEMCFLQPKYVVRQNFEVNLNYIFLLYLTVRSM